MQAKINSCQKHLTQHVLQQHPQQWRHACWTEDAHKLACNLSSNAFMASFHCCSALARLDSEPAATRVFQQCMHTNTGMPFDGAPYSHHGAGATMCGHHEMLHPCTYTARSTHKQIKTALHSSSIWICNTCSAKQRRTETAGRGCEV